MNNIIKIACFAFLAAGCVGFSLSQVPKQVTPVPLTAEAHHHLAFSSPQVRAFYVILPAKDSTLIHQHDVDYVWVGMGEAKVVNATVNKPEVHLYSKDAALHFTRGGFAHAARNEGDTVYRNETIEILQKQDDPRNLCEQVLNDQPIHCVQASPGIFTEHKGVSVRPEFETEEIRFDLVTLDQSRQVSIKGSRIPPLIIALDKTNAQAFSKGGVKPSGEDSRSLKDGDAVSPAAARSITLRNTGTTKARFLVFEFHNKKG